MTYLTSGKRLIDITIAAMGMIFLLPLFFVLTAILALHHQGRPLFFQRRPGLYGKVFRICKFRTIHLHSNNISPFCRWLRSTSLDEIPQLWNVVKGEMSLIGPRPLLLEYLPHYTVEQQKRHHVRPGLTGWAQIHGRASISTERKCELDVWYVQNISFSLDLHILLKTFFSNTL